MRRCDHAALQALADAHHGLITLADAAAHGINASALRWAAESGRLHRVAAGCYTPAGRWESSSPRARHLLILLAAQRRSRGSIVCGPSAAVVLGLPLPDLGTPTLMSTHRKGNRSGVLWRRLTVTRARRVGPLVITTPERTVVDCARCLDRPWGLAVADAALHAGLVDHAQLVAELTDAPRAEGLTKARWVVEHARSSPESPLESLGRADLLLAGRPQTEPQGWLRTARGWVRVDLLDRANRLVLEADGRIKYGEFPAVWKEKLREDDIRDLQIEVVRFTMADHHHQEPWLRRYDRALARGRLSATQLGPVPVMVPPFRLP